MYFLPSASLISYSGDLLGNNVFGALNHINSLQQKLLNEATESRSGPRAGVSKFLASYSRMK